MAARDPSAVPEELVAVLAELCRRSGRETGEAQLRAALAGVGRKEERALRAALLGDAPARSLGPAAWIDVARGLAPVVAAARETAGYYALQAERDAPAAMLTAGQKTGPAAAAAAQQRASAATSTAAPTAAPTRTAPPHARAAGSRSVPSPTRSSRAAAQDRAARAQQILGLFAWHRDAPLVARALGLSLDELDAELDDLKARRKAYRLVHGSDADLPIARAVPGAASGPPVRRRARQAAQPPAAAAAQAPDASAAAEQSAELRRLLAQVGARRSALATRLGRRGQPLPEKLLLARFRAAGLERELGQRERDLLRALFARHRGAKGAVARELGTDGTALQQLILERGLAREIEELRERFRAEARRRRWPREQIEQLVRRREWLEDLELASEIERDVLARARPAWQRAQGSLQRLRGELRLSTADARALLDLLERAHPSR